MIYDAVLGLFASGNWKLGAHFFWTEFTLNYFIATYSKPQVLIYNHVECLQFFVYDLSLLKILGCDKILTINWSICLKVSILNGIVMGGGAGLSIHGTFRVATENTVLFPSCVSYANIWCKFHFHLDYMNDIAILLVVDFGPHPFFFCFFFTIILVS